MTMDDGDARNERFKTLYRKYYRRMIGYYMRAFRLSEEDAEELAQEAFLRFYEAMDEYRGEAEWAFLETIARNLGFNRIRSQKTAKRSGRTIEIDAPGFAHEPATPEPDYAGRQQEALRKNALHDAIADLPPGQRQCIHLWLEDFQYDEIARTLRISMDAVRSRLRDARKVLRARLGDEAMPPEDEQ